AHGGLSMSRLWTGAMRCSLLLLAGSSVHAQSSSTASCTPSWVPTFTPRGDVDGNVFASAVFDDGRGAGPVLYIGGTFTHAGGKDTSFIARWDGEEWASVGSGVDQTVEALLVAAVGGPPALYVAGGF